MFRPLIALLLAALLAPAVQAEKRSIQKKAPAAKPGAVPAAPVPKPQAKAQGSKPRSLFDPPPVGNVIPVGSTSGGSGGKPAASGGSEAPPPQAGALLRSEGLVAPAEATPVRRHEVDGGSNFITDDPGKSQILNPHPGIRYGKADNPPSSSSGSGEASGKTGVVANKPSGE